MSYKAFPGAHKRLFRLKGPLYGQRTAPYVWWETLTEWLVEEGFIQSKNDPCLYHKPASLERVEQVLKSEWPIRYGIAPGNEGCLFTDSVFAAS